MKGDWDDVECLAYEGPIRIAFDGESATTGFMVYVDDVAVARLSWPSGQLEAVLRDLLPADAAKRLAREAASNLGPWV